MDSLNSLTGMVRRCVDDYGMIAPGDRIAVGVSGGKDSLVLLSALAHLRRYYPAPFGLEAITIDAGFPDMDFSGVAELCRSLEVPYTVVPTDIREIVFEARVLLLCLCKSFKQRLFFSLPRCTVTGF